MVLGLKEKGGEIVDGEWVLADTIELGKPYVIVADGKYAMTNRQEGPALRTYAGNATTTLASAAVTVEGDKITSCGCHRGRRQDHQRGHRRHAVDLLRIHRRRRL